MGIFTLKQLLKYPTFVLAYPGTGKSECRKLYSNVSDYNQQFTSGDGDMLIWLRYWVSEELKKGKNVITAPFLLCHLDNIVQLEKHFNTNTLMFYPSPDCLPEYLQRYKDCGRSEKYIRYRIADFDNFGKLQKLELKKIKKVQLRPGQFLDSALKEQGLKLHPREYHSLSFQF